MTQPRPLDADEARSTLLSLYAQYLNLKGFGYVPTGIVMPLKLHKALMALDLPECVAQRGQLFDLPIAIANGVPVVHCTSDVEIDHALALARIRPRVAIDLSRITVDADEIDVRSVDAQNGQRY